MFPTNNSADVYCGVPPVVNVTGIDAATPNGTLPSIGSAPAENG
jgi:hypothetical protein